MKLSKLIKEIKRISKEEDPEIAVMSDFYGMYCGLRFDIKYLNKAACIIVYDDYDEED